MTHGFNLDDPLVCEGIVGDGCGGGRIFFVEENALFVYDPFTKESLKLFDALENVTKIEKRGCDIHIFSHKETIIFNLSLLEVLK